MQPAHNQPPSWRDPLASAEKRMSVRCNLATKLRIRGWIASLGGSTRRFPARLNAISSDQCLMGALTVNPEGLLRAELYTQSYTLDAAFFLGSPKLLKLNC